MTLNAIDIVNFKNIAQASLRFSAGVNCLLGMNGMGKSNLLEAIHLLSTARGMTPAPENMLIRHGESSMLVKGEWQTDDGITDTIACGFIRGKGKTLKVNGKEYHRISKHLGRYPVVCVTPQDYRLIADGAEERRRLMDMGISQGDATYLAQLIRYNKALESRNKMLRAGIRDKLLYESIENAMCEAAAVISKARQQWIELLKEPLARYYSHIAEEKESAEIAYRSALADKSMAELLETSREKDQLLGYTGSGIQRDDIEMTLNGYSIRRTGSQGQTKTFTIALRLAMADHLRHIRHLTPLLLLDDIFDKLDSSRVTRIVELVGADKAFGQIFISDTNREHLDEILNAIGGERTLFNVDNGQFTIIEQ